MLRKLAKFTLVCLLALSVVPSVVNARGGAGGGSTNPIEYRVTGYVTAIDYEFGLIQVGASYYGSGLMLVDDNTKVSLNNNSCSLQDLVVGDWAECRYVIDGGVRTATKISASGL